jgi:hypothetical protein
MSELEDLRYPVGRFKAPASFEPTARAEQISILRQLPSTLQAAVSGLNHTQLDTPYRDGGWTVRQLVHHIADSHANAYVRTKLALTEDWPTIKPYDEAAWARLADSNADFQRGYNHPENGRQDLATVLAIYAWHSRHHTAHITKLRSRQNW